MFLTIASFVIILVVLILVHEFGHAVVAWLSRCRVEEFGLGFPPRIAGKKVGETLFSLNLIPLGGFVRITGEDGAVGENTQKDVRSFANKNKFIKLLILVAGVTMNILLAVLIYTIIAGIGSNVPVDGMTEDMPLTDRRVEIVGLETNDALKNTDIKEGDAIVKVGEQYVTNSAATAAAIRGFSGHELSLTLKSQNTERVAKIIFDGNHKQGEPVGLALVDMATYRVGWLRAPLAGIKSTGRVVQMTAIGMSGLFHDLFLLREVPKDVAGPVGIAKIVGDVGRQGFMPLMELTAILSVNLALINILPIPALDGGRALFVIFEALGIKIFRGKREQMAHSLGFALLILLVLLITINDIRRLFIP